MPEVMMALGGYRFAIGTAAFQTLRRATEYRWAQMNRIGRRPAMQYVGPGVESIDLDGVIYPHFRGGLRQVEAMRAEARLGLPLMLVSGTGYGLGLALARTAARSQGGEIRVETADTGGARFHERLPRRCARRPGRALVC